MRTIKTIYKKWLALGLIAVLIISQNIFTDNVLRIKTSVKATSTLHPASLFRPSQEPTTIKEDRIGRLVSRILAILKPYVEVEGAQVSPAKESLADLGRAQSGWADSYPKFLPALEKVFLVGMFVGGTYLFLKGMAQLSGSNPDKVLTAMSIFSISGIRETLNKITGVTRVSNKQSSHKMRTVQGKTLGERGVDKVTISKEGFMSLMAQNLAEGNVKGVLLTYKMAHSSHIPGFQKALKNLFVESIKIERSKNDISALLENLRSLVVIDYYEPNFAARVLESVPWAAALVVLAMPLEEIVVELKKERQRLKDIDLFAERNLEEMKRIQPILGTQATGKPKPVQTHEERTPKESKKKQPPSGSPAGCLKAIFKYCRSEIEKAFTAEKLIQAGLRKKNDQGDDLAVLTVEGELNYLYKLEIIERGEAVKKVKGRNIYRYRFKSDIRDLSPPEIQEAVTAVTSIPALKRPKLYSSDIPLLKHQVKAILQKRLGHIRRIKDVERINLSPFMNLAKTPDISWAVEEPLIEACKILKEKGIITTHSSANAETNGPMGFAWIKIDTELLSLENKEIGERILSGARHDELQVPLTLKTPVAEVSKQMVALASQFKEQNEKQIDSITIEGVEYYPKQWGKDITPEQFKEEWENIKTTEEEFKRYLIEKLLFEIILSLEMEQAVDLKSLRDLFLLDLTEQAKADHARGFRLSCVNPQAVVQRIVNLLVFIKEEMEDKDLDKQALSYIDECIDDSRWLLNHYSLRGDESSLEAQHLDTWEQLQAVIKKVDLEELAGALTAFLHKKIRIESLITILEKFLEAKEIIGQHPELESLLRDLSRELKSLETAGDSKPFAFGRQALEYIRQAA